MTNPVLDFVSCGDGQSGHRMAYWRWGPSDAAHVVLCVHGLTRQGRDFDALAQALLTRSALPLRVICPDVVGRGESDWLSDPLAYQVPQYAGDMERLLQQLHLEALIACLDYVGTSMGGLIGMVLAGHPGLALPAPVRRFVLNDVGPNLEYSALKRISAYVGQNQVFDSVEAAAAAIREISTGFGPHTAQQWMRLSRPMFVPADWRSEDGRRKVVGRCDFEAGPVRLHYDPALAEALRAITPEMVQAAELATWALYDAITARTLLLRGAESDLLSRATALAMTERGPRAALVEFDGVGHAPTLVAATQTQVVTDFLLQ